MRKGATGGLSADAKKTEKTAEAASGGIGEKRQSPAHATLPVLNVSALHEGCVPLSAYPLPQVRVHDALCASEARLAHAESSAPLVGVERPVTVQALPAHRD